MRKLRFVLTSLLFFNYLNPAVIACSQLDFSSCCESMDLSVLNPIEWATSIATAASGNGEHLQKYGLCSGHSIASFTGIGYLIQYPIGYNKASSYHICYDDEAHNHPMPYTDSQIIQLLPTGEERTVENVVSRYEKLCVQSGDGEITWLDEGECVGDICATRADGYSSVMCASVVTACPCVMNVQFGTLKDPEYKKNSDGSIVLDKSGNPVLVDASILKRYAKHCRIKRYPQVASSSSGTLSSLFDSSCSNMRGYSKGLIPVTAAIAQCVTETTRNIFEKPIFTLQSNSSTTDPGENYKNDIAIISAANKQLQNILQGRQLSDMLSNVDIPLSSKEIASIAQIVQKALNSNVTKISYCQGSSSNTKTSRVVTLATKYSDPSLDTYINCCSTDANIRAGCIPNAVDVMPQMSISNISDAVKAVNDFNLMTYQIQKQYSDFVNMVYNVKIENINSASVFQYTMYEMFTNRVKVFAVLAVTFWVIFLGFKILLGEVGVDPQKMIGIFVNVAICYFIIFNNDLKSWIFRMIINVSHGTSLALFNTIQPSSNDARTRSFYFGNPKPETAVIDALTQQATCPATDTRFKAVYDHNGSYLPVCLEYKRDSNGNFVYLSDNQTKICIRGLCKAQIDYVPRPNYENPYIPLLQYNNNSATFAVWPVYCRNQTNPSCITSSVGSCTILPSTTMSPETGQIIYKCNDPNYVLDNGYLIKDLIAMKILVGGDDEILLFQNILPDSEKTKPAAQKIAMLKEMPLPTANSEVDRFGNIIPIDFDFLSFTTSKPNEQFSRAVRITYLESKRAYKNSISTYPVVAPYGFERDMSYLALFDKIDKYVIEAVTLKSLSINGQTSGIDGMLTGVLGSSGVNDLLIGMFDVIKFIFISFPFGVILAILILSVAMALIMSILSAVMAYIGGIIGLAVYLYIAPMMVILNLFESTQKAFDQWKSSIIGFIIQAITPFFSLSLLLIIYDFALYGYPSDFETYKLFSSDGSINGVDCFKDHESIAPVTCLIARIQTYMGVGGIIMLILAIIALFFPIFLPIMYGAMFVTTVLTGKLFVYAIWKALVALVIIVAGNMIVDKMEDALMALGLPVQKSGVGSAANGVLGTIGGYVGGYVTDKVAKGFNAVRGLFTKR